MLEFIDSLLSEPLKDLFSGLKNETILWKQLRYDIKKYIDDLGSELDEFNIHRANKTRKISSLYIEPKLSETILSEQYYFDVPNNPEVLEYLKNRNPKALLRKRIIEVDIYKNIYELIEAHTKIVILGQPGSGKTTILRKLVLDISSNCGVNAIPVFIPLRNSDLETLSVKSFIQKQLENHGIDKAELLVTRLLEKGKLILLFDGIDEVKLKVKQRIIEEINQISIDYPLNIFIATSRVSSYNGELMKFKESEVREFSFDDTILFINNWFENDEKKYELIQKIKDFPQVAEIANNPLLLSLICIVYDYDLEISSRRSTLYKRCIECLMRDWDAQRNFRRESKFSKLDELKRISILSHLGFHLHKSNKIYFDFKTIESHLSEVIQRYGLLQEDIHSILEEVIDHYGLILEVSRDVYSFSHLTFQEYFAANYIADKRLYLNDDFNFTSNPFWEEVLIICSSILPDSTEYLISLLEKVSLNYDNIIISGLCLSVDPVIDINVKKKVVYLLLEIYHNVREEYVHERSLYALARIDDTFVGKQLLSSMGVSKHFLDQQAKKKK